MIVGDGAAATLLGSLLVEIVAAETLKDLYETRIEGRGIILDFFKRGEMTSLKDEIRKFESTSLLLYSVLWKKRLIPKRVSSFFPMRFSELPSSYDRRAHNEIQTPILMRFRGTYPSC